MVSERKNTWNAMLTTRLSQIGEVQREISAL
jgi:hypothetical protein